MRANKIRMRKIRDKWEITTYAQGARGARRIVASVLVDQKDIGKVLSSQQVLEDMGIPARPTE